MRGGISQIVHGIVNIFKTSKRALSVSRTFLGTLLKGEEGGKGSRDSTGGRAPDS